MIFKYKPAFFFTNYAKLFFSCNKIPQTEDYTDAFIKSEEEFSGLLYELLSRLPRVLREGVKKITSDGLAETYDKYTRGSDPVKYFVDKVLIYPAPDSKIPKVKMYEYYDEFCREFGLALESPQSFSRKLSEDFHLEVKRYRIKGEQVYCWDGVKLRNWQEEEKKMSDTLEDFNYDFSDETKEDLK